MAERGVQHTIGQNWHHLPADEVVDLLETDAEVGLDVFEVMHRQKRYGANVLTTRGGPGALRRFLLQFNQPLIYILLAAGAVTLFLREWVDAAVIFGVVLVNATIGYLQEAKAVEAIEALAKTMTAEALVLRAGEQVRVSATEIVPGDVVLLQAGDKVPADLRLIRSRDLQIDESALTGESLPVDKHPEPVAHDQVLAERTNMAYASSLVTFGQGAGVVIAIGDDTEVGRISGLISEAEDLQTPLTQKIAAFSKLLLVVILALGAVTFVVGLLRGESLVRHVQGRGRPRRGGDPGGPAGCGDHHPGDRRLAHGQAPRDHPQAARRGDAGQHDRHLHRQDRDADREPDDGAAHRRRRAQRTRSAGRATGRRARSSTRPRRKRPRRRRATAPCARRCARSCVAGALCNDSRLVPDDERWTVQGDPTEGALLVAAAKAGMDRERLQAEAAAGRFDPVRIAAPVHGDDARPAARHGRASST